ncbi:ELMO domain-containing protein 1 [Saguinus oedipus]|uniref:ELMO domain-containing protein 1 n=1 Tax=Saguinus oedipus TaxID=9490 RepID=A0ABQ9UQQ7_SAGOE|nr:ELMO domain-containing protein 1 [Saguinus oedipus]
MKIETSLRDSKSKTSVNVHPDAIEKTIEDIMELKKINPDINPQMMMYCDYNDYHRTKQTCSKFMREQDRRLDWRVSDAIANACLLQIVGYRNLIADVEKLRREPYDSDNPQHEEMLLKVSA